MYSDEEDHRSLWARKKSALIWRDDGSGGRGKEHSWHRLVDMLNSISKSRVEAEGTRAITVELPSQVIHPSRRARDKEQGAWLKINPVVVFINPARPSSVTFR